MQKMKYQYLPSLTEHRRIFSIAEHISKQ